MTNQPWYDPLLRAFDLAPITVAALVVGSLSVVVGALTTSLAPEIGLTGRVLLWAGLALLLVGGIDALRRSESAAARRHRRYGLNVALAVVLFLVLIGLVNALAYATGLHLDATASKQFTLAEQSAAVLEDIEGNIEVTAFFVTRAEGLSALQKALRDRTEDLLREFERESDGRLTYRFVDPELDPVTAQAMGINRYPTVVFTALESGRSSIVAASNNLEQSFLTALLVVSGRGQKTLYTLTGHGELSLEDATPNSATGFGLAAQGLANDGYRVQPINLVEAGTVPVDAATLVIASPVTPLSPNEMSALEAYLVQGGRVLALLEPESDQTWREWAGHWGISVERGYVIDPQSHLSNSPGVPLISSSQYAAPYITGGLDATVFPGLAPVGLVADPSSIPNLVDYDLIALTSPAAFAGDSPSQAEATPDDPRGPFLAAVLLRSVGPVDSVPSDGADAELGSLAVFGDGQFVSNRYFTALSNGDLFLNTVNELAGDVPLVPVRSKPLEFRAVVMTESQFTLVRAIGWGALPTLMAIGAVVAWLRRR
jgi:ABC-type uncharacterized transport system involved in gliding motility auxiliary subunit